MVILEEHLTSKAHFLLTVKWSHVLPSSIYIFFRTVVQLLLFNACSSIQQYLFVYSELNGSTYSV